MEKLRKLRIAGITNQDNAVGYYRIIQPLKFIAQQELAEVQHIPFFGQNLEYLTTAEKYLPFFEEIGPWADCLFSTIGSTQAYLSLLLAMKDKYKLPLIIDIDDDPTSVHLEPNNPAYKAYLEPGNRHSDYAQMSLQLADMVTVSTPYLYERFKYVNKNVVIVPNAIDTKLFKKNTRKRGEEITIGYAGSGSHQKDLEYISPVIKRIKEEFPQVRFKAIGPCTIPEIDEKLEFTNFTDYPKALKAFNFDIGIAPIRDSLMNRAKSNLRWLEYTSLGIPTVASDVEPFKHTDHIEVCVDRQNWYESLKELIEHPGFRKICAEDAYTEMKKTYNPLLTSHTLFTAIERIIPQKQEE